MTANDVVQLMKQMMTIRDEPTSSLKLREFADEQVAAALTAFVDERIIAATAAKSFDQGDK